MGFVIVDRRGYFLVDTSKHRGSAAGYGRIVGTEAHRAMNFGTREEGEEVVVKEFQDYEIRDDNWHVEEVNAS